MGETCHVAQWPNQALARTWQVQPGDRIRREAITPTGADGRSLPVSMKEGPGVKPCP